MKELERERKKTKNTIKYVYVYSSYESKKINHN